VHQTAAPLKAEAVQSTLVTVSGAGLQVEVPAHERDIAGCLLPSGHRVSL